MMDSELDKLLGDAVGKPPELSTRLMENIIADAASIVPPNKIDRPLAIDPPSTGWLQRLLEPVGGMPALVAAAGCAIFGVYIGYTGTDTLQSIPGMDGVIASFEDDPLDDLSIDSLPIFDSFLAEG